MAWKKPNENCQHITIRDVDSDKWSRFRSICALQRTSANQMVKTLINDFVSLEVKDVEPDLIEDLRVERD